MRWTLAALTVTLLPACQETLGLPAPQPPPGARAALLVVTPGEQASAVVALDLDKGQTADLPLLSFRGELEAGVLHFRCPLARLSLAPGEVPLGERVASELALPRPLEERALELGGSEPAAWRPVEARAPGVDEALRRIDLAPDLPCTSQRAQHDAGRLPMPDDGRTYPLFLERLPDGRVIAGSREGATYLVDPEGEVEPITIPGPDGRGGARIIAAHAKADGDLFTLDEQGQLARGPLGGPRVAVGAPFPVPTSSTGLDVYAALDGDPAGAELCVQTNQPAFGRFDGERWTVLGGGPPGDVDPFFLPTVAWLGPGHCLGHGAGEVGVVPRYRDGRMEEEPLPERRPVAGIGYHADFGELASTIDPGLFARRGPRWERLAGVRTGFNRVFAPLGPGRFIYAGNTAFANFSFGQYLEGVGACPLEDIVPQTAVILLERLGDVDLLAAVLPSEAIIRGPSPEFGFSLIRLERTLPAEPCGP